MFLECIYVIILGQQQKKYMVMIGFDKKAFFVSTVDKKCFPLHKPNILSYSERLDRNLNDIIYLYWENGKVWEPVKATFKYYGIFS